LKILRFHGFDCRLLSGCILTATRFFIPKPETGLRVVARFGRMF